MSALALAIAGDPDAIAQNQLVAGLHREKYRLTQRIADLANAQVSSDEINAQLQAAISAGADVIVAVQESLEPGYTPADLAMALAEDEEAVNTSGQIADLAGQLASANAKRNAYDQAVADLAEVSAKLDEAIAAGANIIIGIQERLAAEPAQ